MTNADAWNIIEKWARENMSPPPALDATGPDLSRILSGAGGRPGEFSKFMPRRPKKK